jgi:hypothetical protein
LAPWQEEVSALPRHPQTRRAPQPGRSSPRRRSGGRGIFISVLEKQFLDIPVSLSHDLRNETLKEVKRPVGGESFEF